MEMDLHQKVDGRCRELRKVLARCRSVRPGLPWMAPRRGEYPLRARWDSRADPGALSRCALDLKCTTQACDTLAHRLQAEVSRERARRIEALAIVPDFQEYLARVLLQPQLHTLGLGVLDRVVQGLLGDAI